MSASRIKQQIQQQVQQNIVNLVSKSGSRCTASDSVSHDKQFNLFWGGCRAGSRIYDEV